MANSTLTLTNKAKEQLASIQGDHFAVRIGLKKGGCAGMEYTMELANSREPLDIEVVDDDVRVLIGGSAQLFLLGMEVDYEDGLLQSGFVFNNPNVAESCGCGESVNFNFDVPRDNSAVGTPSIPNLKS